MIKQEVITAYVLRWLIRVLFRTVHLGGLIRLPEHLFLTHFESFFY